MKEYINVGSKKYSTKTQLPKRLESYDGRRYFLHQGKRIPSGFWASYDCCFHADIVSQGETLEECKKNLAIKTNLMIEDCLVKKMKEAD